MKEKIRIYICTTAFLCMVSTNPIHAFDINSDGKEGLAEAIHALQVIAGIIPTPPATGDAMVQDVLTGKVFSNSSEIGLEGTMINRGAMNIRPSTTNTPILAGYHNGSGIVTTDPDLSAENIKYGSEIFGITGTFEGDIYCYSLTEKFLPRTSFATNCNCQDAANACASNYGFVDMEGLQYWHDTWPLTADETWAMGRCSTIESICINVQLDIMESTGQTN